MTRVVFLLVPRLHLLDLAGPAQVFSTVTGIGFPYELTYVAEQEDVPTAQGLTLQARTVWPELTPRDLIMVPGWQSGARPSLSAETMRRLRDHHASGGTLASVCSGAFALARAGLLDGRRCTTHHSLQDELVHSHPSARVIKDVLFVLDDRIITSAGIASGIDLALHLVATEHGPATAAQAAREMVVYARRNGDQPQHSAMLRHRSHLSDLVHHAQDVIDTRFTERLLLPDLAASLGVSDRTLTRLFVQSTGLTPLRYQQALRLERAEHLISQGSTVEYAARATGFQDARMLRRLRSRAPMIG